MNIGSYWFSDKIVLRMSGAKPATRSEYFDLWNAVENLSITAGLPKPKVFIIKDSAPNAFATGRNKQKAVIAVTSGLLEVLDKSELEGVIAHELSHIGNNDMLVSTVAVILVGVVTMISDILLRATIFGNRSEGKGNGVALVIGLVLALLMPLVASLLRLSISRKRELLADATGAMLTRYPEGLARALEKIHAHGPKMKSANHATAHLFIANPFGLKKTKTYVNRLFMTHPPVEMRIDVLRGMDT
jgi:heat shock protein HtpX